jgi:hypothetical protein
VAAASVLFPLFAVMCGERAYNPFINALNPTLGIVGFLDNRRDIPGRLTLLWMATLVAIPIAYQFLVRHDQRRLS